MSREIKFRAWDGKKIRQSNYFDKSRAAFSGYDTTPFNDSEGCFPDEVIRIVHEHYGWEWMQYTGLKDKNGKEIYEDDLVKVDDSIFKVTWDRPPNGAGFYLQLWKGRAVSALQMYKVVEGEIIGNIWENKDLL